VAVQFVVFLAVWVEFVSRFVIAQPDPLLIQVVQFRVLFVATCSTDAADLFVAAKCTVAVVALAVRRHRRLIGERAQPCRAQLRLQRLTERDWQPVWYELLPSPWWVSGLI